MDTAIISGEDLKKMIQNEKACEQSQAVILISKTTVEVPEKGGLMMTIKEDLHTMVVAENSLRLMTRSFTKEVKDIVHGQRSLDTQETILLVGLRAVRIIAGRVEVLVNLTMMTSS